MDEIKKELNHAYKMLAALPVSGDAVDVIAAVRACIRDVYKKLEKAEPEKEE